MKTTIFVAMLCMVVYNAEAQIKKNAFLTGLDLNYSSTTQDFYPGGTKAANNATYSNLTVRPMLGYFLSDRLAVGVGGAISHSKFKDGFHGYPSAPSATTKALNVFVRYYFKASDKVYFFLHGEAAWATGFETPSYSSANLPASIYPIKNRLFTAGIRPGIAYFITPRLALESTIGFLGYTQVTSENDPYNFQIHNVQKSFAFQFSSSTINLGFRFYLAKRAKAE